jgi:Ca2+/Na+ antiporter
MKKFWIALIFLLLCYCIYLIVASYKAKEGIDDINQQREKAVQMSNKTQ